MPKVFFVILTYNSASCIRRCLSSVFATKYANFEVVVVDNNSKDGTQELVRSGFSRAHFIKNSENRGFAAGCNVGIRFALEKMAQYVFLLNPDTEIESDALASLVNVSQERSVGLLSPLILDKNSDNIWFAGGEVDWKRMRTIHLDDIVSEKPFSTELVTGCALLVKADVFGKTGLLDEDFFLYYEDADFSLRAKQSGFEILIVPEAKVYHWELSNLDNKRKVYWLVISGIIFFNKHTSGLKNVWIKVFYWIRKIKNRVDLMKDSNDSVALIVAKAYKDYEKFK